MRWGEVFDALPPDLSREETLFFDAVDLLVPAAELQYERTRATAGAISEAMRAKGDEANAYPDDDVAHKALLVSDATSFLVTVQRLRRVVHRLRGAPDMRIAKGVFESAIKPYEGARHYLEHLDASISTIAELGHSALGAISWLSPNPDGHGFQGVMVIPGHIAKGEGVAMIKIPSREIRSPADHLWITIGGEDYYVTGAAEAVKSLEERLRAWSARFA